MRSYVEAGQLYAVLHLSYDNLPDFESLQSQLEVWKNWHLKSSACFGADCAGTYFHG